MGGTKESLFINKDTITGKKAFSHYIRTAKIRDKQNIANNNDRDKIVKAIFKEIHDGIVEDEEGVVMDGLGYFAVVKQPIIGRLVEDKTLQETYLKTAFNTHSDYYVYNLLFIPEVVAGWKRLTGVSMDRAFNGTLKKKVSAALKRGKKYKFKYKLASALLAHQQRKTKKYLKIKD